jgi:NTE family protein
MTASRALGPRIALVLPGGGARSAWQVGVVKAIAGWYPAGAVLPFPVLCGTSAGAINATVLGAHADDFGRGAAELARVWAGFRVGEVFRAGTLDMLRSGLHLALALVSGGWLLPVPRALLDNAPLRALLARNIDFARLRRTIAGGLPDSLAISATSLTRGESVAFIETSRPFAGWDRAGRRGTAARIGLDHLMASSAVPFLFPPVSLGDEYYGDGAMREANPFSAAIHLGAHRLLVVGTRNENRPQTPLPPVCPTFGQIFGYMLDALFSDGLYADLERLTQINHIVERVGPLAGVGENSVQLKRVDIMVIMPSRDLSEIARQHTAALPRALRNLLRTMGALNAGGGQLMSYLMFQDSYTRELIALGYQDAMKRSDDLLAFLGGFTVDRTGATQMMKRFQLRKEQSAEAQ